MRMIASSNCRSSFVFAAVWVWVAQVTACGDDGDATTSMSSGSESVGESTSASEASQTSAEAETTAVADSSSSDGGTTGSNVCEVQSAIVADIDATLTTADSEFFMQLSNASYDPLEREGAAELMNTYYDLGYRVMYLTARSETFSAADTGETARELTVRWLEEHGFPLTDEGTMVVLAPNVVIGPATAEYKTQALADQQALGWVFDYAYGNASTDVDAYIAAGIPLSATFIIGEAAGEQGTVAVEGEGWLEHMQTHLPTVPGVCAP